MTEVRAARWTESRELEVVNIEVADPGEGEVQVAVQSSGICGSDLHFFRTDFAPRTGLVPGHEFAGTVSAVGKGVDHVREGDLVGIEPILRCGKCRFCVIGEYNMCLKRGLVGEVVDGGMSELANVPANTVFRAPPGVDAQLAAMAEPLACSVHAYEKVHLGPDETVLIVGAGTIGLTAVLASKAIGAHTLITARYPHQQEAARRLGADEVIGDDEAGRERLAELAKEHAIDLAVETVGGHADTIIQAQNAVRRRGRVLLLGIFTQRTADIAPFSLAVEEKEIIGALTYAAPNGRAEYDMALDVLAGHADQARTLVTHQFALDDINEGFATALDKSSKSIKVQVDPRT